MYTTYHFNSATEINADILEAIKIAFRDKPVVITITEEAEAPDWQEELVLKRQQYYLDHPEELLDWETAKKQFKAE